MTDSFIGVPGSTEKLDAASVTTAYSGGAVLREGVYIGDPDTGTLQAKVLADAPCANDAGLFTRAMIYMGDSVALDAFGRLRVSEARTIFDSQQEYGLDTLRVWDATANGTLSNASPSTDGSVTNGSNAVGPTSLTTRMTPITVSSTNGHYSILQSRIYTRYVPGKSHLIFVTGVFASGSASTAAIVYRTSCSGSVVDTVIQQANWNIDKMDGTGCSGITLDLTKTQILFIQAQWLGVGRVIMGFDIDGVLCPVHQFLNANSLTVPYTQTFNLPVRLEARATGAAEHVCRAGYFDSDNGFFIQTTRAVAGGTMQFVCCSVQSEGGVEQRGFPNAIGSITSIGVTTRRPVLSIRPKATFNSRTNRAHIKEIELDITAANNNSYYEIVLGGTLTGAAFASVGTSSVAEYDTAATAITGGKVIESGFVLSGSGSIRGQVSIDGDTRAAFVLSQIDALTAHQDSVSIVCTSLSGTSNITSAMHWHEQTV
jgi:hypothetical protein